MVIAVTGASGFVGRHVLSVMSARGTAVRALARNPAVLPSGSTLTTVQGDLSDTSALARLCEGATAVLHIAGALSGTPAHLHAVNEGGTAALLQAADRAGVKRFVHVSSLAAREPALSAYAESKAAGEAAVRAAARGLSTLIIRPPAVYGEGDRATLPLLKALTAKAAVLPGSAAARFSLIHAEDFARICVAALESPTEDMREVDDGHGAYSWADVSEIMRAVCGRPQRLTLLPRRLAMTVGHAADGVAALTRRHGMISAGKMRELYHADWVSRPPGWPRDNPIPLHEGMHRTLHWAMAQGLLPHLPLTDRSAAS